ncbi:hypothetical protein EYF80_018017 [Liparis tanakae]|uniref:Uncharacterized protein n=1 Tax=Liparis tanakae TaxID=230148 RepID=A0A4Z2I0U4_9TELE|nr:hypothetical protein EYF80_018017 [Liparis tanakae]
MPSSLVWFSLPDATAVLAPPSLSSGILQYFTWDTDGHRVLSLGDGLLGSPFPRVLVAITLNSYSTQGNRSTTVAISSFPSTSAGAAAKKAQI